MAHRYEHDGGRGRRLRAQSTGASGNEAAMLGRAVADALDSDPAGPPAGIAARLTRHLLSGETKPCQGCGRSGGELTENGCPACGPSSPARK